MRGGGLYSWGPHAPIRCAAATQPLSDYKRKALGETGAGERRTAAELNRPRLRLRVINQSSNRIAGRSA